jgi:hypothetical protein
VAQWRIIFSGAGLGMCCIAIFVAFTSECPMLDKLSVLPAGIVPSSIQKRVSLWLMFVPKKGQVRPVAHAQCWQLFGDGVPVGHRERGRRVCALCGDHLDVHPTSPGHLAPPHLRLF